MVEHQSQMNDRYLPSTPMDRVSTALPSVTADETDDSDSLCNSSDPSDVNEDNLKQDSSQSYSIDTSFCIAADDRATKSSKKQVSLSAIENMGGADANAQDLNISDDTVTLPSYMFNFERPRSGCDSLSWNALPLAVNSNFLSKRMQIP